MNSRWEASTRRHWAIASAALVFLGLALWLLRHVISLLELRHGHSTQFETIYAFSFLLLFWQWALYTIERPVKLTARRQRMVDEMNVVAIIPAYNEDPALLEQGILSIINQTRPVQRIFVIDDGSVTDYGDLRGWVESLGVEWHWKTNGGKRSAQAVAINLSPEADVYLTVDSDSVLDPHAVEEILKPFADKDVHSVAGVVVAINSKKNLVTRITDLWWVTGQLVDRSSMSVMGSVLVNSGVLAAYRATIIRKNLHGYLNETYRGRKVEYSDDSLLTIYALVDGKAVQQPSAYAFTALPENINHHVRQYLRWMRGAFIRTIWRFRYLPVNRYAYWAHFAGWVQTVVAAFIVITLFVVEPIRTHHFIWQLFLVPLLIGYAQATRYLAVRRSDESLVSQLFTYSLVPVAWLWGYFGLRVLRWYAIATHMRLGWGTRQDGVEVGLGQLTADRDAFAVH